MTDQQNNNTQTNIPLIEGTEISQYRIVKKIGAGGMGEVFLADDTKLNRRVALKFLPAHLAQDADVRARFIREAQAAAGLHHPNVITVHEVSKFGERPFFAMQYVDGKTLHHYAYKEPLDVTVVIDIVAQIAEGLAKAHSVGLVHRDIKSVNVILDDELRPIILDFGLVAVSSAQTITKVGSTLGTLSYMSPEQAQGLKLDNRTDIFSLGVVLYELLTGKSPFQQAHDAATLYTIIHEEPEPLSAHKDPLPDELQNIVTKCLIKEPANRYQSAKELANDLRAVYISLTSGASKPSVGSPEGKPSIAVLPFANMSADPENEYFSDGLTEELLNVLARNPELRVTGRTSSFAFKGKQEDLREIGHKLGVSTILEGSVRKAGNRVRITAQLVKTTDGFHLWSDTYDRVIEDIFAVQDEIAAAVANEMHVTLVGNGSGKRRTVNPESYELFLRGKELHRTFSMVNVLEAEKLYKKALEIDPENAEATVWLGTVQLFKGAFGGGDRSTREDYLEAKRLTLKGLEMDDTLADGYYTLSWIRTSFEFHFEEGRNLLKKGLGLAPNHQGLVTSMALQLALQGEFEKATEFSERAIALDPLNPESYTNHGRILQWTGDFIGAAQAIKKSLELSPETPGMRGALGVTYLLNGNPQMALEEALKEISDGYRYCVLAMVYFELGEKKKSDDALAKLLEKPDDWMFQVATAHAYRYEADEAFAAVERAIATHDAGIPATKVSPYLARLHSDPRWPKLLKRIGFADS